MDQSEVILSCTDCGKRVETSPTTTNFQGQEVYLFYPVICLGCLIKTCKQYSTICVNCDEFIPPYSQIGVLKGNDGESQFVHMTTSCLTVGNAFHGYWGKGQLLDFVEIEAC
jgi:hypothetical protein